jgi:hypothetical protein
VLAQLASIGVQLDSAQQFEEILHS